MKIVIKSIGLVAIIQVALSLPVFADIYQPGIDFCNADPNKCGLCSNDSGDALKSCEEEKDRYYNDLLSSQNKENQCQKNLTSCQNTDNSAQEALWIAKGKALCQTDLISSQNKENQCQNNLTSCQGRETQCQTDLTSFQGGETQCQTDLTSFQDGETQCQKDLTSFQDGETQCQKDLTSFQDGETQCQKDLTSFQDGETQCQKDLTSCRNTDNSAQEAQWIAEGIAKGITQCQSNPASCGMIALYLIEPKYSDGTPFDGVFMKYISHSNNIYQFEVVGSQATQMPSADDVILEIPEVQYFAGLNEMLSFYCVKMTLSSVSNDDPLQFKITLVEGDTIFKEKPDKCPTDNNADTGETPTAPSPPVGITGGDGV